LTHQPRGLRTGITLVVRGGSFEHSGEAARCASRSDAHPGRHVYSIGFRLALVPGLRRP
jgi:formylglycine-generating enzyme required for sulfatase activity